MSQEGGEGGKEGAREGKISHKGPHPHHLLVAAITNYTSLMEPTYSTALIVSRTLPALTVSAYPTRTCLNLTLTYTVPGCEHRHTPARTGERRGIGTRSTPALEGDSIGREENWIASVSGTFISSHPQHGVDDVSKDELQCRSDVGRQGKGREGLTYSLSGEI